MIAYLLLGHLTDFKSEYGKVILLLGQLLYRESINKAAFDSFN